MTAEHRRIVAQLAWSIVPPQYRQWSVIAGGFAACPEKAGDIDLYMLGKPDPQRVIDWLKSINVPFIDCRGSYGNELVIAGIPTPFLSIQLIGAKQTTVEELLDSFDVTTHMWAMKENGQVIRGQKATGTDEPGKIVRFDTPEWTAQRAEKIGRRYCIGVE